MSELDVVTTLEIIDTAVKIGLGAFIAGVAAYFLAKLNHRQDLEKDNLKRRRELLEKWRAILKITGTPIGDSIW